MFHVLKYELTRVEKYSDLQVAQERITLLERTKIVPVKFSQQVRKAYKIKGGKKTRMSSYIKTLWDTIQGSLQSRANFLGRRFCFVLFFVCCCFFFCFCFFFFFLEWGGGGGGCLNSII